MDEPKFSPGPWTWDTGECRTFRGRIISGDGQPICDFGDSEQYYPIEGSAPDPADLALILAAPAMYEALRNLIDFVHDFVTHKTQKNMAIAIADGEAALALADGKGGAT